jgi:hypothetical protein
MGFDEAYQRMRAGDAIACPGWVSIACLFYERGTVWANYRDGSVRAFPFFKPSLVARTDWFIFTAQTPLVAPPPKSVPPVKDRKTFTVGLAERQAEMKRRWEKSDGNSNRKAGAQ